MIDLLKAYGIKIIETDEEAAKLLDRNWLDISPLLSISILTVTVVVLALIALWSIA